MRNITFKEALLKTAQATKDYIDDTVSQSASNIISTVSSTYATKEELGDMVEVGDNLIMNGTFAGAEPKMTGTQLPCWEIYGGCQVYRLGAYRSTQRDLVLQMTEELVQGGISQYLTGDRVISKNTEFTLSFYWAWQQNVNTPEYNVIYNLNGDRVHIERFGPVNGDNVKTFTTPNIEYDTVQIRFKAEGLVEGANGSYVNMYLNKVKLELGATATPWKENNHYIANSYTTKTEFQDFAFRIAQSGGGNLIKNSLFKNGTKYWYHLSFGNNMVETNMWPWEAWGEWNNNKYNALTCFADINTYGGEISAGFDTEWIDVQPNTAYSFSCYLQCHRAKEVHFEVWYDNDGTNTYFTGETLTSVGTGVSWGQNYTGWTRYERTFITPNTKRIWLRIYMGNHDENGDQGNAYLWLAQPVLVEGYTPSKVWVPHESELYDGIVKIDDKGLTVEHNSNKQSVFDSESLKFYDSSGDLYSKIDGGAFRVMKPGDSSTIVGSMGRFKWTDSGICCTAVASGLGYDVALGSVRASGEAAICNLVDSSQGGFLTGGTWYYDQGLNITKAHCGTLYFKGDKGASFDSQKETDIGALNIWASKPSSANSEGDANSHTGYIYSRDTLQFGVAYGPLKVAMEICETANASNNTAMHMYGPLNMHGYDITNAGWTNPVSASSEYTSRLLREGSIEHMNYGTLSYYDGELRWCWREPVFTYAECDVDPVTDEWVYTGRNICYVELPIFMAESIEQNYHIQVGKIGWGDYRILEKNQYYFILESQEEDFAFTFEVVAKLVDGQTLDNNVSIASMSTTANPAINVEPPTAEEIILSGSEDI